MKPLFLDVIKITLFPSRGPKGHLWFHSYYRQVIESIWLNNTSDRATLRRLIAHTKSRVKFYQKTFDCDI